MPMQQHAFLYVECDVPAGVTLGTWRADRAAPPAARPWLVRLLMRRSRA
jgi:hypothetical protein